MKFQHSLFVAALVALTAMSTSAYAVEAVKPAPEQFSWTGCHIGLQAGVGAAHNTWADTPAGDGNIDAVGAGQANTDMSGGLVGGQVGCDWQTASNWVFGAEAAFAAADITGTNQDQFNSTWTLRSQIDGLGAVTGRAGWAAGNVLVYGRAGVAFELNDFNIQNTGTNLGSPSTTRFGWTVGPGVEWAFAPHFSIFMEGDYYSFGDDNVHFSGSAFGAGANAPFDVKTSQSVESLKFGLNYRF